MAKFEVQFDVHVTVQKSINADSMEQALAKARTIAKGDPVNEGLVRMGRSYTYNYNDETEVTAVLS